MPGPYPLSTLACTINANGISSPSYSDILSSLKASFQAIYGSDIITTNDSQDGQFLALLAQAQYDTNQATIAAYNSFSPATAQGVGLSSIVKINGLRRLIASNSSVNLTIVGVAGTIINNGIATDGINQWNLPSSVTIPSGGSIVVTAIAQNLGAITASANTIINISTPTLGWQTVNNAAAAVPGAPVETDYALRQRQTVSTGLPAQSVIGALYGALANLSGVQSLVIYENDTGTTDANGVPAHSISCVVQGGDAVAIATIIEQKKTPGTGTYGTTSELITDPVGIPVIINFYVPTQVAIDVNITIKAYNGYVSTTGSLIISQITAYLNSLGIGSSDGKVFNSKLYSPANDTGVLENTYNVTSLTMRRGTNSYSNSDIAIAFNELPISGNINLTVT